VDLHKFTARHPRYHQDVARWIACHSGLDAIVDNDPARAYWLSRQQVLVTNKKLGAALYIDDRALRFEGDWAVTLDEAARRIGHPSGLGM
jgi:hypothetical protein